MSSWALSGIFDMLTIKYEHSECYFLFVYFVKFLLLIIKDHIIQSQF